MKTVFIKPASVKRKWHIVDAQDKVLGRVATRIVSVLRGKTKPFYTPHQEIGDYVIVVNAGKIRVSGDKENKKIFYHHSGHIGGIKSESLRSLRSRRPCRPLELAIKGMLPHNKMGYKLFKNVKIYEGNSHPHIAQNPQILEI